MALEWPFKSDNTEGGEPVTSQIDRFPSRDEQQIFVRSLFANFTIVTAWEC